MVSKLLRHSDPAITLGTYGHLDVEDLRQAVRRVLESERKKEKKEARGEGKSGAREAGGSREPVKTSLTLC